MWWGAGMVICLERGADLHVVQLMLLPLTVSCFSKIQIGFTFLVLAHLCSPGKRAVKRVCVCLCVCPLVGEWNIMISMYVHPRAYLCVHWCELFQICCGRNSVLL